MSDPLHFSSDALSERDRQSRPIDGRRSARNRKHDLRGCSAGDVRVELQFREEAIRRCFRRGCDAERAAVEIELFEQQATRLLEQPAGDKPGLGAEEVAKARRNEDRDRPVQAGGEAEARRLLAKPRRARQHALRAGIERQCQIELGKRALALQGKGHRRPALDAQDIGDNAVGRLVQREVETKNLGFLGVVRAQRQPPAGTIEPRHVEGGIQRPLDKLKMSADADLRRQAEHALAEGHERHVQRSDVHGQRKLRYLQRAGLGRRHPLFRHRTCA